MPYTTKNANSNTHSTTVTIPGVGAEWEKEEKSLVLRTKEWLLLTGFAAKTGTKRLQVRNKYPFEGNGRFEAIAVQFAVVVQNKAMNLKLDSLWSWLWGLCWRKRISGLRLLGWLLGIISDCLFFQQGFRHECVTVSVFEGLRVLLLSVFPQLRFSFSFYEKTSQIENVFILRQRTMYDPISPVGFRILNWAGRRTGLAHLGPNQVFLL